jgi:hypothetical protein
MRDSLHKAHAPFLEVGAGDLVALPRARVSACCVLVLAVVVGAAPTALAQAPLPTLECPEDLRASEKGRGDILLTWTAVAGAEAYQIVRVDAATGGDVRVFESTDPRFLDTNTTDGVTYRYTVLPALVGEPFQVAEDCESVEATAIPFLGSLLAVGLATVGAVGALVLARRR